MAIKNPEKPKKKMGSTARQEQCSLAAIYFAYKRGASLNTEIKNKKSRDAQFALNKVLNRIYGTKIPKNWYNTFIEQAQVLCAFSLSSHKIGTTTDAYDFGWYDGTPQGVSPSDTTTLMQDLWELFGSHVWKLFGGRGQKDSWNTADVFMVKKGQTSKIYNAVKVMHKNFIDECCTDPGVFVGSVNTLLTQYVNAGILLPISLKVKTSNVDMRVKPTNIHEWGESGSIDIQTASFITPPFMYFDVLNRGGLNFGEKPTGKSGGNSLQYFAQFRVGDYETKYLIEQRMSGDGTKAEIKDILLTNKGTDTRAGAQTGTVPGFKFKEIIKDFSGEDEDHMVLSKNSHLNKGNYIEYWGSYLESIVNDSTIPKSIGNLSIRKGNNIQSYKPKEFIKEVFELDQIVIEDPNTAKTMFETDDVSGFSPKLRLKLKQLRFIKSMISAKKRFPELIIHLYYLAAKQNISEADLNGPFLKIY
jgi:hypothetical protein|tara:strand:- start:50 stop:1468 length:1419 start_codon:yes stop_codon:yes gene_type:complete